MKALSVKDPWATAILTGEKTIELRSWPSSYFGDLLICASSSPKTENSGKALCIVKLAGFREMQESDEKASLCDYDGCSYSWILENVRPIKPFPVKGKLKLYDVDVPQKKLPKDVYSYALYKGINEIGYFNLNSREFDAFISRLSEIVKPAKRIMRYAGKSILFFLLSDTGVPLASFVRQNSYYGGAMSTEDLFKNFIQKEADYPPQDEEIEYNYSAVNIQEIIDKGSQEDVIIPIINIGQNSSEIAESLFGIKKYSYCSEANKVCGIIGFPRKTFLRDSKILRLLFLTV